MLQVGIEAEVQEFMLQFNDRLLDNGRAAEVRNGHQPEREVQTGIGPVTIKVPKVRSRDGEPVAFRSALVPPYLRKTKSLEAALAWPYLKGVSTGEMSEACSAGGPRGEGIVSHHGCSLEDELLAFYDFPAAHWKSIRTANPIESTFATIRHRTKRSKGCLSGTSMLHRMFKLGQCAQKHWHRLRGFDHLANVIRGIKFKYGIKVETADQIAARFNPSNTTLVH